MTNRRSAHDRVHYHRVIVPVALIWAILMVCILGVSIVLVIH